MQQFFSLFSDVYLQLNMFSGVFPPIISSSMTAVAKIKFRTADRVTFLVELLRYPRKCWVFKSD